MASKLDLETLKAVGARAAQKMDPQEKQTKNPRNAGRKIKPIEQKATNKITLNLTDAEFEKFNDFCVKNGMSSASAIRYCLVKQNIF